MVAIPAAFRRDFGHDSVYDLERQEITDMMLKHITNDGSIVTVQLLGGIA